MGLFAARPEEPFDWAGLPSEPLEPKAESEFLAEPPADPFAITGGTSISIAVPAAPTPAAPDREAPGAEPSDGDDGPGMG